MSNPLLDCALAYHAEGLNVIPVVHRDKKPALPTWEEYHTRISTETEIRQWFGNGKPFNIGLVHCKLADGCHYIALDLDHDNGLCDEMYNVHPYLFKGRIEQSGSGKGYHVPLKLDELPDFGMDQKQNRPRGNRTWKTNLGHCNVRLAWCQTVAPPSIHPSGNPYRFVQSGEIVHLPNLQALISWLDQLAPPPPVHRADPRPILPATGNDLIAAVKGVWGSAMAVFEHFEMAIQQRTEPDGQIRLMGNGGLLLTQDLQQWFCFSDEIGGDMIEAWGYCRFGNSYDKARHFRQVLLEMAVAGGIDIAKFYKRGDEAKTESNKTHSSYWAQQYSGYWSLAR